MNPNFRKNFTLSIISLFVAIILTVSLDRSLGRFLPIELIYPPNASVRYKTTEFDVEIHINHLGFRGPSFTPDPFDQKFQIMTLGDSFTYGWGVKEEDIWSTILSNNLNQQGMIIEVANLGWGGAGPTQYADLAEKAIPLLQPNLVIVGILQGDDLEQLDPTTETPKANQEQTFGIDSFTANLLQILYPNISRRILQRKITANHLLQDNQDIRSYWQYTLQEFLKTIKPDQLTRFNALEPEVKQLFQEGLLNPGLIGTALNTPNYLLEPLDLTSSFTQIRIKKLAFELERIKRVAQANKAEVIVVAVPLSAYTNEQGMVSRQRVGFNVAPEMFLSSAPDEAIALAAQQAGVKFYSVLDSFRQYKGKESLFYPLDGHFTIAGNQFFAQNLLPIIENEYRQYQQKN